MSDVIERLREHKDGGGPMTWNEAACIIEQCRSMAEVRLREIESRGSEIARLEGECDRSRARLNSYIDEWDECESMYLREIAQLKSLLDCRAGKLLKKHKFFLVVANDEPYFSHVYDLIRKHERHHGRWSEGDERMYCEQIAKWDWPKSKEEA